jgi:hypothetical protein
LTKLSDQFTRDPLKVVSTMAQKDATEQAKEFLRLIIKYRFWISISVAALFALIAYFVGSGPVRAKAAAETTKITNSEKQVQQYSSPTIPTQAYQPVVQEKTQILTKDVNVAWKTLFDRQAPLLTWPETVQERFRKWGRKWPENEAPRAIELAIVDYIEAYPEYVSMVYKTANPFDYDTGEGVVAAPVESALLRPAQFTPEHLPDLGKVWGAQERLWIQRTMLEVIAQVNKNAKNWDTAVIRQILALDVGDPSAQDQRSIAKNETLEEAPSIHAPGEETADASVGGGNVFSDMGLSGKFGGGMANSIMGGMGGGLSRGPQAADTVFYVKSDAVQYKKMPVVMTVLIDQDHVQDFLVEMENSPMSIQVMDFELERPTSRVTKPEKGSTPAAGGFTGGMGMGMMGMMGMGGMMQGRRMMEQMGAGGAFGGMAGQMQNMMGQSMMMGMRGGRDGGMGGLAPEPERKGTDKRSVKRAQVRTEKEKADKQAKGVSWFDPYFDIVQVTVYGQARFFMPPPVEPAAEPSPGESAAAPSAAESAAGAAGAAKDASAQKGSPPAAADGQKQQATAPAASSGDANEEEDGAAPKPAPKPGAAKTGKDGDATGKTGKDGATAKP